MIQLNDIQLAFADKTLFDSISWRILPGERIGLVGDNGVGKTTLLKILTAQLEPDAGEIHSSRGFRLGLLEQDFTYSTSEPLLKVVLQAAADVHALQEEMAGLQEELESLEDGSEQMEPLVQRLSHLQEQFENRDGFRMESEARRILSGLGFSDAAMQNPLDSFSGGWQMRAALARLLLSDPDLLLMDEPTNHLDEDSVEWLERYLTRYRGALVVVSHDRYFLDRVSNQITELERGGLNHYAGNFSNYRAQKEADRERLLAAQTTQAKKLQQTERFIERFRAKNTKATQVKSRIKALEKMDRIEVEDEESGIRFRFPPCVRSGETVLRAEGLAKSYGDQQVFENLGFEISRGERVALVGPNGAGKSTLIRLIAGLEQPTAGSVGTGHNVELRCYNQEFELNLSPDLTLLEEIAESTSGVTETKLRGLLGAFRFPGEDVFKHVGVLSGGEKSRLAVAKLLLGEANFLVLDEPTNHLDIKAKDVLQEALEEYEGTVLIVSHDRYFLDGVVKRVWELRDGRLRDYLGDYSYYLERREQELEGAPSGATKSAPRSKEEKRLAHEERTRRKKRVRELERKIAKAEDQLAKVESRMKVLEAELEDTAIYDDRPRLEKVTREHAELRKDQQTLYEEWETASEELEEAQSQLRAL